MLSLSLRLLRKNDYNPVFDDHDAREVLFEGLRRRRVGFRFRFYRLEVNGVKTRNAVGGLRIIVLPAG